MQMAQAAPAKSPFKRYLFTYRFDGADWSLEIPARSLQEAKDRVKVLAFARCDGETAVPQAVTAAATARRSWFARAG